MQLRQLLWSHGGEKVALAVRLGELPLRALVRGAVKRIRRDPALWVFGGTKNRFGDNVAYLYVHLAESVKGRRCVWITGSRQLRDRIRAAGLEAELRWSRPGIRACARAGWYITSAYTSDINRWLADGATLLNLWHGVPLKRIERDIASGPLNLVYSDRQPMKAAFADQTRPPDFLLAPSKFIAETCFLSAFGVPIERCLTFGYPRNDHFLAPAEEPPHHLLVADPERWFGLRRRSRVVGYFPTWRDHHASTTLPTLDLPDLAASLSRIGAHLVFKPHFNSPDGLAGGDMTALDPDDDADAYLPLCDVLVTDYSSLAFDFMLLDRPIVYFTPDLDDYANYRGFYFSPSEMMPGSIVKEAPNLAPAIEAALASGASPQVAKVRDLVWGDKRGCARERLLQFLLARS
ncbi:MAG: CDP-glycerol glycerophosphotransferase family protein [Actinomycetota bacterium]|nr:CDP-glycerol glycerophosphotransferase family protein [Actinomycetota bacterium]